MDGRTRWLATVLLSACVGAAHAGTLYKCVGRGGVAYQTTRCDPGAATAWAREFTPDPPAPAPPPRMEPRPRERVWAPRYARWYPRASREPVDPCAAAKAHRDRVLARVGLKRTFDLLRQLDDAVYDACK